MEPVAVERAPAATVLPDPSKDPALHASAHHGAVPVPQVLPDPSKDPAVPQAPSRALASKCKCDGRGLQWALVNQAAQFVITAHDADGNRRTTGGDPFVVKVR